MTIFGPSSSAFVPGILIGLFLSVFPVGAAPTPPAKTKPEPAEVPLEIIGRVPFVKAQVNGTGPLTFILDTGATETVITPPVAAQLKIGQGMIMSSAYGVAESVAVGNAVARTLRVYIFDPPQALPLRLDKGVNYAGILGYPFLNRFVTTVDYRRLKVRFDPAPAFPTVPKPGTDPATGAVTIPFTIRDGLIHATGTVNGKGPLTFLVDTGSAEVMILPRLSGALGLQTTAMPQYPGVGFARATQVTLGEAKATDVPVIVHTLAREHTTSSQYDGILGYPFLSNFRVSVNYQSKALTLVPDAAPAEKPAPKPTQGRIIFVPTKNK